MQEGNSTEEQKASFFRFRDFPVYKDLRLFRKYLKLYSKQKFPADERFVLRQQMWRALDSTILNIAEGADRHSDKDFSHFLNNSLTSLNEVVSCLDIAYDDNYLNEVEYSKFCSKAEDIVRQLKAFISKVRKDNRRF